MNQRILTLLVLVFCLPWFAPAQVALKPWIQMYGEKNQRLGYDVRGIVPTANFPYRAAVSTQPYQTLDSATTAFYTLSSPLDTLPGLVLRGRGVLTADFNSDGYTDVAITRITSPWDTVFIYWGTASGIDTLNPLAIPCAHGNDVFMTSCVGDINNDGKPDLILTAANFSVPYSGMGKVYIFLNPVSSPVANYTITGDTLFSTLGVTCAIGDLNHDGYNDLIVRGWYGGYPVSSRYDYVNIYWGVGIDTVNVSLGLQMRTFNVNSPGLACFDANGDGVYDLLWTARDSIAADYYISVHFGGQNFSSVPSLKLLNPGVANFGHLIASGGDMNGDGYEDILVSADRASITSGFAFIFAGGPNIDDQFDAAAGLDGNSSFGYSASAVGDVNGDGLADVIVGAPDYQFADEAGYWTILKGDSTMKVNSVGGQQKIPTVFKLYQSYPNPFNPSTTIRFELFERVFVRLEIFSILGQRVETLIEGLEEAGSHEVLFEGKSLSSGVYYYRLTVKRFNGGIYTDTKKLVLIR